MTLKIEVHQAENGWDFVVYEGDEIIHAGSVEALVHLPVMLSERDAVSIHDEKKRFGVPFSTSGDSGTDEAIKRGLAEP